MISVVSLPQIDLRPIGPTNNCGKDTIGFFCKVRQFDFLFYQSFEMIDKKLIAYILTLSKCTCFAKSTSYKNQKIVLSTKKSNVFPKNLNNYEFSNIFSTSCPSSSIVSWSSCYCFVSKPSWKPLSFAFYFK